MTQPLGGTVHEATSSQPVTRRLVFVLLVGVLLLTACSSSKSTGSGASGSSSSSDTTKPVYGGSVVYAQDAEDAGGLCLPEAQLDAAGINYARTIYDTLTVPNAAGKYVPFLAQSVTKNADATVWTIVLRSGVKFHDGTPLTATVVKNNLDAYRGAYPARHPILFGLVFGPYVKDVTADDASNTVTVTVDGDTSTPGNQGWQAFDTYLWSSGRLGIMAQAQLDDTSCAKNLIGTGPFKLKEWVVNDHFTAVKNPDYWGTDAGNGNAKLPYLDEITFKPVPDGQQRLNGLQSGQFQLMYTASAADEEQLRALEGGGSINVIEASKYTTTSHLMLCAAPPTDTVCPGSPFSNVHARNAVAFALDRQSLNHVRAKDIPQIASGPFPPGSDGHLDDTGFPQF